MHNLKIILNFREKIFDKAIDLLYNIIVKSKTSES
jgi:hypothetical protein